MATDPDVLQLVGILEGTGFGAVAGELLTQISLGREVDTPFKPSGAALDGEDDGEMETDVRREPIEEAAQFDFAIAFLHSRLVVPALALGEAERLAGTLAGRDVPVAFVLAPAERAAEDRGVLALAEMARAPGDDSIALKLGEILSGLPLRREPPTAAT
jgi:hypothetical protein